MKYIFPSRSVFRRKQWKMAAQYFMVRGEPRCAIPSKLGAIADELFGNATNHAPTRKIHINSAVGIV